MNMPPTNLPRFIPIKGNYKSSHPGPEARGGGEQERDLVHVNPKVVIMVKVIMGGGGAKIGQLMKQKKKPKIWLTLITTKQTKSHPNTTTYSKMKEIR